MELIQAWYNQNKQAKCFQLRHNLSKLNNSNYQINVLYAKLSLSVQVVMNPQFGAPNFAWAYKSTLCLDFYNIIRLHRVVG